MRYDTQQHTREGWTKFKADLDAGETREISEEIATYLGCTGGIPAYRDLDGSPVRIWRDTQHRYWVRRSR